MKQRLQACRAHVGEIVLAASRVLAEFERLIAQAMAVGEQKQLVRIDRVRIDDRLCRERMVLWKYKEKRLLEQRRDFERVGLGI